VRLTLIGTGTSFGVPQIGCACRVCRSSDPRDRRRRAAAVLATGDATILIDTPPELRLGLLESGIGAVDAVLFTHDHADHTHGIDDLRSLSGGGRGTLPVFGPADALDRMRTKFDYVFDPHARPLPGSARPAVDAVPLAAGVEALVAGVRVLPIAFEHGPTVVFGYRFGPLAYVTDVKTVPDPARTALAGVEVLILNSLWYRQHPTHLSIPEAVEVAQAIGARQTWLTHLTHETAHADLEADLPPGIRPGYDGLVIEV